MLGIYNYIRGYVVIEVSGFSVERFINLAVYRNIYLWDIQYNNGKAQMKVSIKGFKLLKHCAKKTKCKVKIKNKLGYPFLAFKYRKRKVFISGIIFFSLTLYYLSSFVWLVEIKGNERLEQSDIKNFLSSQGLKPSVKKSKIKAPLLEETVLNYFSEISWINIHIKGTKVTVNIKETIEKKEILNDVPSNIVSEKEGLIHSIVTRSGKPLVKEKDVVNKGDILVTGELVLKEDQFEVIKSYVNSSADIYAKVYYNIDFKVPFFYEEKKYTEKEKKSYRINIFNKNLNFINPKIKFENYTRSSSYNQLDLGKQYPLPLIIVTDTYKEFVPIKKKRTLEDCKKIANQVILLRIIKEFDFDVDIVDKRVNIVETKDGILVKSVLTVVEKIGTQVEITKGE